MLKIFVQLEIGHYSSCYEQHLWNHKLAVIYMVDYNSQNYTLYRTLRTVAAKPHPHPQS